MEDGGQISRGSGAKIGRRKELLRTLVVVVVILLVFSVVKHEYLEDFSVFAVVRGNSMFPLLREGDIIVIEKRSPEDIDVGDIIVYRSLRGSLIVHRVMEILEINGTYYFRTKGDNNLLDDRYLNEYDGGLGIRQDRVVGVAAKISGKTLKIPYLGSLALIFS